MKRNYIFLLLLASMALLPPPLVLASASESPTGDSHSCQAETGGSRIQRHIALAAELEAEGADDEARLVRAEIGVLQGGAAALPVAEIDTNMVGRALRASQNDRKARSVGARFARGVVSFYRTFVSSAIGARCVLEPSCSRYFLEASRKHGLLGLPMLTDRLVREPAASAPDRPWVQTPSGQWRHPDPVSEHDWWF